MYQPLFLFFFLFFFLFRFIPAFSFLIFLMCLILLSVPDFLLVFLLFSKVSCIFRFFFFAFIFIFFQSFPLLVSIFIACFLDRLGLNSGSKSCYPPSAPNRIMWYCCILTFDLAKHAIPKWCTRRKWHIPMTVMRGNRVGGLGWKNGAR